jgi:hypothetical protein
VTRKSVYPLLKDEARRSNADLSESEAYHVASDFQWSQDSNRVVFAMAHGAIDLELVMADLSAKETATSNISQLCESHCQELRVRDIQVAQDFVTAIALGSGHLCGYKKNLSISNREFIS